MVAQALKILVSQKVEALPLLDRFDGVYIDDCSSIKMPPDLAKELPGCGGGVGGNDEKNTAASIKVFCRYEITTGRYEELIFASGKTNDNKLAAQAKPLPSNSLHLADMGFFNTERFAEENARGVFFISRVPSGKKIGAGKTRENITSYLRRVTEKIIDIETFIGDRNVPVRFVAIRVPEKVSQQRQAKIRKEKGRKGKTISAEQFEMSKWTVFVTNIPKTKCAVDELSILYSVRWQIELVFKLWKSECEVGKSNGTSGTRCLCEFYAKMIGVIIVNWLTLTRGGMLSGVSATKQYRCVQQESSKIAEALKSGGIKAISLAIGRLMEKLSEIKPQSRRRKHPSSREKLVNCRLKPLS